MKKILCLTFVLCIVTSLFSACGCAKKESNTPALTTEKTSSQEQAKNDDATTQNPPAISENKEVVKKSDSTKIYIKDGLDDMMYHLKDCSAVKDASINEASWEFVQTIGLWQCPTCNPPRYEGYKNAE